jgi:DNA invertase Pin-like site-specific DNA recombinase
MSKKKAVAYYRTSSAANVGSDQDSERRQRAAVEAFARQAGYDIVDTFYDAAISGGDPIDARPGFTRLLKRLVSNGARTVLVETASRFARDLIVQETGWRRLRDQGIELIAVDSPRAFLDDTPTAAFIRQVLGAVAQLDKAMTVAKLKAARDRKKARTGKCEGRKGIAELKPETVALARSLHKAGRRKRTLREIAGLLAEAGHLAASGKPYSPSVVAAMLRVKAEQRTAHREHVRPLSSDPRFEKPSRPRPGS